VISTPLRDRLLDAAADMTCATGWREVTMAKIAQHVGVSRQTVYNELGSRPQIAENLVLRELARFLEVVSATLMEHEDVVDGLRSAPRKHCCSPRRTRSSRQLSPRRIPGRTTCCRC